MQQRVAPCEHIEVVGVAAADDAGERETTGADGAEDQALARGETRVGQ
jgi:hypothetical protein